MNDGRKKCCFPMWGKKMPPREQLVDGSAFCGEPTAPGSSYCAEHHAKCWEKPAPLHNRKRVEWIFGPLGTRRVVHGE